VQNRIIELSEKPSRLRVRNRLLEISSKDQRQASIPIADVAVLISAHPQVSLTQAVLGELAGSGGVYIACDQRRQPVGMMLPLNGFHQQVRRFQAQANATAPTRKRCWQQLIRAKINGQAKILKHVHGRDSGLSKLVPLVKSGDPTNVEARAARRYWQALFGTDFRRDRDQIGINQWLNYGYTVVRAIVARSICASGLHPGLGLHHHHRESGFPLADDLMEPFRCIVDNIIYQVHCKEEASDWEDDTEIRRWIISRIMSRYEFSNQSRTLFDWSSRMTASLANRFDSSDADFEVPSFGSFDTATSVHN
jgi:CRISPR-associated protein Cas1